MSASPKAGGRTSRTWPSDFGGDLLDRIPADDSDAVFIEHPERGVALAAWGVADEIRTAGPGRFAEASRAAHALFATVAHEGPGPGPVLIGGFAFAADAPADPRWAAFPSLSLLLPAHLVARKGGRTWETTVDGAATRDDTAPEPRGRSRAEPVADWATRVDEVLRAIESGRLAKVVLARTRDYPLAAAEVGHTVRQLRDARPNCVTYWVRRTIGNRSASFVGSTPELLARVEGEHVDAMALAGSASRSPDPERDAAIGRALLACPKNAAEHAFVADDVAAALADVCKHVRIRKSRTLRRVPEAFHIASVFEGRLREPLDAITVAGLLHPTSAVCGMPRTDARELIARTEPDRGWYSGGIGWMTADGDGEFAVALRCGLIADGTATAWAGAGIVRGSDADAELEETETKLEAMAHALLGHRHDG